MLKATVHRLRSRPALAALIAGVAVGLLATAAGAAVVGSGADPTWMTNGRVNAVLVLGDRIYIGGQFTQVRSPDGSSTRVRNNVAAIDVSANTVDDWNPNANGAVAALATDGTTVFAGGTFSTIGGLARSRVAALDPVTGAAIKTFHATPNGKVAALTTAAGQVFAGGQFTSVADSTGKYAAGHLAALDAASGHVVQSWQASTDNYVYSVEMSPDGQRVFVAGDFDTISGSTHHKIAAVAAVDGAVDPNFQADGEYLTFGLAVTPTAVYAAVGGPGGRLGSFDPATGHRNWWVYAKGDVQAVAVDGDTVYAGGHFAGAGEFANATRWRLAAVDTGGQLVQSFAPHFQGGAVWALATTPGKLYVGGDFTTINSRTQQGLAEFSAP